MRTIERMLLDRGKKFIGKVKWNGNHYFQGDAVKGKLIREEGLYFIIDEWEDEYGNEFKTKVEVEEKSVEIGLN